VTTPPGRYPLRNADPEEEARLGTLQSLHDASTIRQFERLGVGPGWQCAELGAGAGSVARWLADAVGDSGSVTAIDRDTTLLQQLAARPNVTVVEGDLMTMQFGSSCFDLVHSRSVLMHLDDPDTVVEHVVPALRPGAVVLFEEADGEPAQRAESGSEVPAAFREVMLPLAAQWTWARNLAARLVALGFTDVHDNVREDLLVGASPAAAFWRQTLTTIRPIVTDADRMESLGRRPVDDSSYDAMIELLENPAFAAPFAARHRVSGRRP
jgi:2-polyprenyl-3-methyl-5-hydroxy-6-metoxy-1,4-benzoquinol methylase